MIAGFLGRASSPGSIMRRLGFRFSRESAMSSFPGIMPIFYRIAPFESLNSGRDVRASAKKSVSSP